MYYKQDSIFDEELRQEFIKDGFYAKPISTKIYLSLDKNNKSIVANSVVMNIEESNEKIPVYSYNSDLYKKYLNGKKIITGFIALRKVTVSAFLNLFKTEIINEQLSTKISDLEYSISELKKINTQTTEIINLIKTFEVELSDLNKKINSEDYKYEEIFKNNAELSEELKNDNLLYYIDKNYKSNTSDLELEIVYEGNLNNPTLKIYDVLFTKKQTEININKNDIIEIYQFIGNPSKNL
jgi:predicted nuclease with TOPRIM domain